jgi:hypothetical protein
MNTKPVSLTSFIHDGGGGSMRFSSTAVQSILSKKGCPQMAPVFQ